MPARRAIALCSLLVACGADGGPADEVASFDPALHQCAADAECAADESCLSEVCLKTPGDVASRGKEEDNQGIDLGEPPAVDCWSNPDPIGQPELRSVPVQGRVEALGTSGGDVAGLCLSVYDQDSLMAHWRQRSRCPDLPSVEAQVACFGTDICACGGLAGPAKAECVEDAGPVLSHTLLASNDGRFTLPEIPTDRPLVIKISGQPARWMNTYMWQEIARTDRLEEDENGEPYAWLYASVVSKIDWVIFPPILNLPRGIQPGRGVVAGEIRDCGTADRSPDPILGVKVGMVTDGTVLGYHTGDPTDDIGFDPKLEQTAFLGIFGGLDIPAGPNRLVASGLVEDELRVVAWTDFYLPPESILIVNFAGRSEWRPSPILE